MKKGKKELKVLSLYLLSSPHTENIPMYFFYLCCKFRNVYKTALLINILKFGTDAVNFSVNVETCYDKWCNLLSIMPLNMDFAVDGKIWSRYCSVQYKECDLMLVVRDAANNSMYNR